MACWQNGPKVIFLIAITKKGHIDQSSDEAQCPPQTHTQMNSAAFSVRLILHLSAAPLRADRQMLHFHRIAVLAVSLHYSQF